MKVFLTFFFVTLLSSSLNLSCKGIVDNESDLDDNDLNSYPIIYHNSFENASDLSEWDGLTINDLVSDPSPAGGLSSVHISGGCVVPHAALKFNPPETDMIIFIEFYGKNLAIGGNVELIIGKNYRNRIHVSVEEKIWKKYKSDKITWPADSTMSIWMFSGGYIPSSMLIDELYILKVK